MKSRTIAILFHEKTNPIIAKRYVISHMARFWRADGHHVVFLYGTGRFVPADVCVVHVDQSVVEWKYLEFAHRYPVTLNGKIRDVRKSAFSENLLARGDDYDGPVVVKTDLNFAGWPEKLVSLGLARLAWTKLRKRMGVPVRGMVSPSDYRVYDSLDAVPREYREDDFYVVEKFLPERMGDIYYCQIYVFMGESYHCFRLGSRHWIVNTQSNVSMDLVEPHPEIVAKRRELGFDYGKFDYTLHQGKPVLLDINKLIGMGRWKYDDEINTMVRARGAGIYGYFKD